MNFQPEESYFIGEYPVCVEMKFNELSAILQAMSFYLKHCRQYVVTDMGDRQKYYRDEIDRTDNAYCDLLSVWNECRKEAVEYLENSPEKAKESLWLNL